MRIFLKTLFGTILLGMLAVTVWASLHENVIVGLTKVLREPWATATLADAYAGFLTFFVWVCHRESGWGRRSVWFVLIMFLGNIAMSAYVLIALARLPQGAPLSDLISGHKRVEAV